MATSSTVVRFGVIGAAGMLLCGAALAQLDAWSSDLLQGNKARSSLGLQVRTQVPIGCGASLLPCTPEQSFAARQPGSLRWAVEATPVSLSAAARQALPSARQGLNLSLVGRKPLFGSSFSVYGRVGSTFSSPELAGVPASGLGGDAGHGLSFGAGLTMEFTPRLSATLGWDSYDLRLGAGPRENLRSTSLGLQYRY